MYVFSTNDEKEKNRTLILAREELCSTDPTETSSNDCLYLYFQFFIYFTKSKAKGMTSIISS